MSQDSGSPTYLLLSGIAQGDADAVVGHVERLEDGLDEVEAAADLVGELLFGAEDVGVVLSEAADASQAVELAGLLPAVDGAELREAHGKIAVAVWLRIKNLDVHRAVHRTEHEAVHFAAFELVGVVACSDAAFGDLVEIVALGDRGELALLVVGEVPGGAEEVELADVRRVDDAVACVAEFFGDEVGECFADDRAGWLPEDEALADFVIDGEEAELFAELAVVARFGLLELVEVFRELVLARESGAVDALKLLVLSRRRGGKRQRWREA